MKLFDVLPEELFSVLASPNRALYADALEVLYTAYRENLRMPEQTLFTMLRNRLEEELLAANFDDEDIYEEEEDDEDEIWDDRATESNAKINTSGIIYFINYSNLVL